MSVETEMDKRLDETRSAIRDAVTAASQVIGDSDFTSVYNDVFQAEFIAAMGLMVQARRLICD